MRKRVVHSTGTVARSDGNDTDCGATGDPDKLLTSAVETEITCKRCIRSRESQEMLVMKRARVRSLRNRRIFA